MGVDLDMDIRVCRRFGRLPGYNDGCGAGYVDGRQQHPRPVEIQRRQLDKSLEVTKAADYPTLGLMANYQWSSMDNTFKFRKYRWIPYSVAAISLNIPIFAGGKRRSDIRQAENGIESRIAARKYRTRASCGDVAAE